jgi:hypothetical protein
MEELAQPVGNAKVPCESDRDVTTVIYAEESRAIPPPVSSIWEHSVALPDTNEVIRRFNRDTKWLAALVVGAVVSAAFILAVLVQDRHPRAVALTEEAAHARADLLPNANSATLFNEAGLKGTKSTGEITSGQASSVDHAFIEISQKRNPSSQMESAASSPTPVIAFTPKINPINAKANASSWSPIHRQDSARMIRPKIRNGRHSSFVRPRFVDAKMRLIALWHQSLKQSERSRSWTLFSNKGVKKKISYTARTNH